MIFLSTAARAIPIRPSSLLSTEIQTDQILLSDINDSYQLILNGPFQEKFFSFNLPADWKITQPVILNLNTNNDILYLMEALIADEDSTQVFDVSGELSVVINGTPIENIPVNTKGAAEYVFEIEPSLFQTGTDANQVIIRWDDLTMCQHSISSQIFIHPDSSFTIQHQPKAVVPGLDDYPEIFYSEDSVFPVPLTFAIPDNPSTDALSAAVSAAASLGKHTNASLPISLKTFKDLDFEVNSQENFILIGNSDAIIKILPDSLSDASLNAVGDDGIILLDNHPENKGRFILVVTGQTNDAVRKAASALGATTIIPFDNNRIARIKAIAPEPTGSQLRIDYLLGDLAQSEQITVKAIGTHEISYLFSLPDDTQVSPESYIELYFRHSQLLNYLQSSIAVSINDIAIGNLRFSDQTAENGIGRIILPPNVIQPSKNTLTIRVTLSAQDICADSRSGNFWLSIFGDSFLHLPPVLNLTETQNKMFLDDFPFPFAGNNRLGDLVFSLPPDQPDIWEQAMRLAYALGSTSTAEAFLPTVEYLPIENIDGLKNNTIVISTSGDIAGTFVNGLLPLPFAPDGSIPSVSKQGLAFNFGTGQPFGVASLTHLTETNKHILSISGKDISNITTMVDLLIGEKIAYTTSSPNVLLVNSNGNRFDFAIEDYLPAPPPQEDGGFLEVILSNYESGLPFLLLGLIILVIVVLIIWMGKNNKNKGR